MSAIDEARLRDRITIADPSGAPSIYGDRVYGARSVIPARVEPRSTRITNQSGEEIDVTTWIGTTRTVGATTRIWLAGDDSADDATGRLPVELKTAETVDGGQTWREFFL